MVYSRNASTRAYIKAVALCALALAAMPSTRAEDTTLTCGVSDNDKSFGIRVVDDAGCANGGLGCYNAHCRYCKILDNPKSTQFESCSSFGANFPSTAALTITTGPCEVSEGDAAAGIAAVTDTECLFGGLGCFGDHCRFCKIEETPESTAFLECNGFNTSTLVTEPTSSTPTPAATAAVAATAAPVDILCPLHVSEGDAGVGINIVSDASCSLGGVGCIDDVCRFCRMTTTVESAAFVECNKIAAVAETPAVTTTAVETEAPTEAPTQAPVTVTEAPTDAPITVAGTCDLVAAEDDIKAGINIVTDVSCTTGGIGCVNSVCRYCRSVYTIHSVAFTDCGSIGTADSNTATITDAAVTDTPVVTDAPTEAPVNTPTCATVVSSGDAAVGINIVTDAACSIGGLGCIDELCRYCKVLDTAESSTFLNCTSIGGYTVATGVPTTVTTEAPTVVIATTEAPVATEAPTDAVTDAPSETPVVTLVSVSVSSGATCTQVVSEGDASVGINITTDTSCANGGVGCIDDICRFCKVTETDESAAFVDCPSA